MLDSKSNENQEALSAHVSSEAAEYLHLKNIFETAMKKLGLNKNYVSDKFQESLTNSIRTKLKDIISKEDMNPIAKEIESRMSVIAEERYYNKKQSKKANEVIREVVRNKLPGMVRDATSSSISRIVVENQHDYKKMYIKDLLEQFNRLDEDEAENLDKFFGIYCLLKKEFSRADSQFKKQESDLTDRYYKKLIKFCNGDKKKFTNFCEKTEGKKLSMFDKIVIAIEEIFFGSGWDGYQQIVACSETKEYEHYLQDEYWKENVPSQNNKNEFTGDTNKITQDHINIKSKIPEKTMPSIQTNNKRRPFSDVLSKSHNNNITVEVDELDQNGKKIKSKDEPK